MEIIKVLSDKIGQLVEKKGFRKVEMRLYSSGIMNIRLKTSFDLLTLEDLEEIYLWVYSLGENKYLNLFEGQFNIADADVRAFVSSPDQNQYTIADAVFIKNLSDKIMGDFYLNQNKPVKPTKLFGDRDEAIDWLLSFKK